MAGNYGGLANFFKPGFSKDLTSRHSYRTMSTMSSKGTEETGRNQDRSAGVGFLEQGFAQLPEEGKNHLKNFLGDLVSLQNAIASGSKSQNDHDEKRSSASHSLGTGGLGGREPFK